MVTPTDTAWTPLTADAAAATDLARLIPESGHTRVPRLRRAAGGIVTPLPRDHVIRLALELARSLAAMHRRGVVHRDITPTSILLTRHGSDALPYLAPEQTGRTGQPVDQRADLYALGATLYELATGAPPFGDGDPLRLFHDHLARVPEPPVRVRPAVGEALSDIIMHLLEKEPDNRYQSAEGLEHDLVRLPTRPTAAGRFRVGERDFPVRLLSPSRLVGRDAEIGTLCSAFAMAQSGRCRGVFVSGPPGVGKTSLTDELRSVVTAAQGWFIAGKFDPYRRNQEFDAVWQIFHTLGRLLLAEPEERHLCLRARLLRALGPDAGLIAALHHNFAVLLQTEPDRATDDPLATQRRLERSRLAILREVASPQRPLVLVLDDLQWAGRAPLGFIDRAMNEPDLDGVLLVGAYREHDVATEGQLNTMLAHWQQLGVGLSRLRLGNLPLTGVAGLLAEVLRLGVAPATELATLIMPRIDGNPYAAVELLSALRQDGLLVPGATGWQWETGALHRRLAEVVKVGDLNNHRPTDRCLTAATELTDPADTATLIQLLTGRHATLSNLGRLDEADRIYHRIDQLCTTALERTNAALAQVSSLTNRNQPQDAVRLGLAMLRELGCEAPAPEQLSDRVGRELDALYDWAGADGQREHASQPELTDPTLLAIGALINRMMPPAFFTNHDLLAWLAVQAWHIWQQHGPARALVGPLSHLLYVATYRRNDHRTGNRIARRILATSESRGYEPETSQARFMYALGGWSLDPIEESLRQGRQAREGLINGDDLQTASYTYCIITNYLLDCAPSLDNVVTELDSGLEFAGRAGLDQTTELLGVYRRLVSVLRGESPGHVLRESCAPERYGNNRALRANLHIAQSMAAALFGDYTELATQSAATRPLLSAVAGTYSTAIAHVLRALACAEQARTAPVAERDAPIAELDETIGWIAARAADAPANFLHLLRLVEAERAWAMGDFRVACRAFDAATGEALTRQRLWHRALIFERAGRFYLTHDMEHTGYARLMDARRTYLAWGATAKVDQLQWAYPIRQAHPDEDQSPGRVERSCLMPGTFDLLGIINASQALSCETNLDSLRSRVVEVLSTITGATGVQLLLWNDDLRTWLVTAPASGMIPLHQAGSRVPIAAVRYVERTGEPLVVSDATRDDSFSRDPYLAGLERCSLLVVPIRCHGELQALLLLENRLIHNAFTLERLEGVTLIAGQLAVSLRNAMVYASMEAKVAERTDELARANERLERLSLTDALTGLANRRRLQQVLTAEWRRARRSAIPVALAMVDIDHFKLYNDRYGHVAGDKCLEHVAALLKLHTRSGGLAARYGGEEFAIVMPDTCLDRALAAAERLRAAVAKFGDQPPPFTTQAVTVSVGVAAAVPSHGNGVKQLTELADNALYLAKRTGRNRVVPAGGEPGLTS